MKARFGATHLIAVIAGLVTALLLLSWTRSQEELVSVVLAAEDVRAGTLVEAADLRPTEMPADASVLSSLISATESAQLVGQIAVRSIAAGEPILKTDLRPAVTDDGRRAMSIPLSPANAVGGDLVVGDQVDVLVVSEDNTRFVAEGVPIVALPGADQGGLVGSSSGWWVTLAVEDVDALEIADGVEHGTIYLLRSTGTPALSVLELVDDPIEQPPEAAGTAAGG